MSDAIRSRIAVLVAPLSPPCGSDARFDPGYEALRDEVKKLESPGGARVDWAVVEKRGSALLSATTKDLLVAAYTAHALFECEGPGGLGAGLLLLNEMLDGFWDGLFPPMARMRARSSALAWWVERTSIRLSTHHGAFDAELLVLLASESERLSTLVRGRFGDAAPAIGPLQQAIERIRLNNGAAPSDGGAAPLAQNSAAAATPAAPPASTASAGAPAPVATATATLPDTGAAPMLDAAPASSSTAVSADPAATVGPAGAGDLAAQVAARAAEWLAPIRADQPAGDDARYDDGYVRVRDQIKRLDSPAGIAVEWVHVLRDSSALLQTRSKDLLIAVHLVYALYDQRGLDGLYSGLCLLHGLLERYWDGLYPDLRRGPRARANAIAWLIARLDTLGERPLAPAEHPLVAQLVQLAAELERMVDARFADQRPALSPLSSALERLALAVPAPAPPKAAVAAAPEPAAKTTTPAAVPAPLPAAAAASPAPAPGPAVAAKLPTEIGPAPVVSNQYELDAFYRKLRTQLWELANALRTVDDADPVAYRLARTASYLTVVDTVQSEPNGNTTFGAPSPYLLGEVEGLVKDQQWQKALALAESSLQKSAYLLDLHRHVHDALQRLGPRYARAQRTVEAELGSLLKRAPELPERRFDNGTPFADAATQEWLAQLAAASGGGANGGKPGDDADPEDQATLAAVRSSIAAGQTVEALEAFEELQARLGSGRERFSARLIVARAHASAGDGEMAAAVFEGLIEELDRHRLDVWDPSLASECLASYYHCLKALGQRDKEMAQAAGVVYRRLCRVDPKRALTEASR
ncbi:MAG TPA: type VI secretion system protein TssA [Polyangiales bacterium]|nr:type VI secretion system protein TssA [Polyangiales bacterium]